MRINKWWIAVILGATVVFALTAFGPSLAGTPVSAPGGTLYMPKVFLHDGATGDQYEVALFANEDTDKAGQGRATLSIRGPGVGVCSTHGGSTEIDWTGPGADTWDFNGDFPLQQIQCGTAYGMQVAIDACTAKVELHGFLHSDYPAVTYTGSITADLTFQKGAAPDTGDLTIKIFTPKAPIKLNGPITLADPDAHIQMDTCH